MTRRITLAVCLLLLAAEAPVLACPQGKQPDEEGSALIFWFDRSESYKRLPAPDTDLALMTQGIYLARLSGKSVKVGAIVFNGDGVRVFGDENRMPTSAYKSLYKSLIQNWPEPNGGTPLDAAAEEAVRMNGALLPQMLKTNVLSTDGQPSSGFLRPEDFAQVKAEMDRQLNAIQEKHRDLPAAIQQKLIKKLEDAWQDPTTEEFMRLYRVQVKAEYDKTLEHAATLRKDRNVRFVSVDYGGGIPELKEIHQAAGGRPADLILATPPSSVIPKLHALGLTRLPRVIVQEPQSFDADPTTFERTINVKVDPIGEALLTTVAFEPPVPDFTKHASLEVEIGGTKYAFDPNNDDLDRILCFDSVGNLATATVFLESIPFDRQIAIHFRSPDQTLHAPACKVYTHLRFAEGLIPELRPSHIPGNTRAPYQISTNHPVQWSGGLRIANSPKPVSVRTFEPVLRSRRDTEVRLEMRADPQMPNAFTSDGVRIPQGTYDVDLHVTLESGAQIIIRLNRHVEVVNTDEFISIEIPLAAGSQTDEVSVLRSHLCFPPIGDAMTKVRIPIILRTGGIDYSVSVVPGIEGLADSQGTSPKKPWITFDRNEIRLPPGRAERLFLTLNMPQQIEEAIVDGLFTGHLSFERTDLGQPINVRRYKPISGVDDDDPVDLVSFTLRRPKLSATAPRGFTNWLKKRRDGSTRLPIPVTIWHPLSRTVTFKVTHDSELPREVTAFASANFVDPQGKQIPSVRLVPAESTELTQTIPKGGEVTYVFTFECDADPDLATGRGAVELSSSGLAPLHIPIEVAARRPLLGPMIKISLWCLAAVAAVSALPSLCRLVSFRRIRAGGIVPVPYDRAFSKLFTLRHARNGELMLQAHRPLKIGRQSDDRKRPLAEGRTLRFPAGAVKPDDPIVVEEQTPDGAQGMVVAFTQTVPGLDGPPEIHAEIVSDGKFAADRSAARGLASRRLLIAACAAAVAFTLFQPTVVTAAQWIFDLVHPA